MIRTIPLIGLLLMVLTGAAAGCHRADREITSRLQTADRLMDQQPDSALAILQSVPTDSLTSRLRPWYALLLTKATDKSYIRHQSDSNIRLAVEYYASHSDGLRYAEALYYAGRVASDMGDASAAIRYYGEAEENIGEAAHHSPLYLNILSQKGSKLGELRLYDEAEEYLKHTLSMSEEMGDSSNLHYDYQALGELYLSMRRLPDAEKMICKALELSPDDALLQCYLAGIKFEQNDNQAALRLIRGIPERIDSVSRHFALAYAADIYREAGVKDTAWMYAKELTNLPGSQNKTTAYHILLGREFIDGMSTDSIADQIEAFLAAAERKYDGNEAEAAIIQNSLYNYARHEAARAHAEKESKQLMMLCGLLAVIVMVTVIVGLIKRFRASQMAIKMHRKVLSMEKDTSLDALRVDIKEKAGELREGHTASYVVKRKKDGGRDIIVKAVKTGMPLSEESEIWREVEEYVKANSVEFDHKLETLSNHTLTERERSVAWLIRCGATPTDLATLIGRGKSTISMYRSNLCKKLFGPDGNIKELDYIIRSM